MPTTKQPSRLLILGLTTCLVLMCPPAHAAKDPKALFDQGVEWAASGKIKKAEQNFKKVLSSAPDNYAARFNLALLYFEQGDYKRSLKQGLEASRLNPFDTRLKELLSSTHLLLEQYEEARTILTTLTAQNPTDIDGHKKLGLAHLRTENIRDALAEFTLVKNLAPADLNGHLLLAASSALNNDHAKALERIKGFKDKLTDDAQRAFYALLLEKNGRTGDAQAMRAGIEASDKKLIVPNLIADVENSLLAETAADVTYLKNYENLEIARRMADKIEKEEPVSSAPSAAAQASKTRPWNLKATLTENWEHYNRRPRTSNPINGLSVTSNLKVEGKTKDGTSFTGEWEGFYNRWDANKLDYYKVNVNKRNNYEVDIGKFSAKHFPTLVSFPTVLEGARVWKKFEPFKSEPVPVDEIVDGPGAPVNLGEVYREGYVNEPLLKSVETIFVAGRTKESKNVDDRRAENEDTAESSGQYEQWTQSYRVKAKVNSFLDLGASASFTQDITNKTIVSSSTTPIESIATGIDGGIDLLDGDLTFDAELAYGNYDEDTLELGWKHARDIAWILKSKYKIKDTLTFDYEQKTIGRNFKVEGASQTQDKTSHTIDLVYKPKDPKTWYPQSQSLKFKPEVVSPDGHGITRQRYTTVQSVTDFKLPQDSKFIFDYKYYREIDKCLCTNYLTTTIKNSFEYNLPDIQTVIKPSYTFERKDDQILAPTDEKKKEYIFNIENKSIKNLEIDYSFERERKKYNGATTKSYKQYINTLEMKYTLIPSRFDTLLKLSKDYKNPSDTNKTIIGTLTWEINYTSKDRDNKFNFKFERKNNKYLPWSDSSAYHQKYLSLKYTRKF